jgi:hypothetical protein
LTVTPVVLFRFEHRNDPAAAEDEDRVSVIRHSPASETNVSKPVLDDGTVIVSVSVVAVGREPTKLRPPMLTVDGSVPPAVHTIAIAPPGGE